MGRTKSISDEQILEAARAVFLEHGFAATTAEIARVAGVSEGSIFRRYPNKGELFMAAMGVPHEPAWLQTLDDLAGRGDLYQNLIRIGTEILAHFVDIIPKTVMMLSCRTRLEDLFGRQVEPPPIRGLRAVTSFFEVERAAGRLGAAEPQVLARLLCGCLHHYAFSEVTRLNRHMPLSAEDYVRGIVAIIWSGVAPDGVSKSECPDPAAIDRQSRT